MKEIKYQQKYVRQLAEGGLVLMFHTLAKSRRQGWVVIGSHRGLVPALHLGCTRRLPQGAWQFVYCT